MTSTEAILKKYETVEFGEGATRVSVLVPEPDSPPDLPFVGASRVIRRCLSAWLGGLSFRLEGPPGVGKNALVYALAREHCRTPIYLLQGHGDMEPQDLVCVPRLAQSAEGRYVTSPLVAAMLSGGICFCDELGKLPERALSMLVSVLDDRRSISSVLAGFSLRAHPDFRFCAALNPLDPPLPDYLEKRLRPRFTVGYPSPVDLVAILQARCSTAEALLLESLRGWLADQDDIAPRDAIAMISFAQALARQDGHRPRTARDADALIEEAAEFILVR